MTPKPFSRPIHTCWFVRQRLRQSQLRGRRILPGDIAIGPGALAESGWEWSLSKLSPWCRHSAARAAHMHQPGAMLGEATLVTTRRKRTASACIRSHCAAPREGVLPAVAGPALDLGLVGQVGAQVVGRSWLAARCMRAAAPQWLLAVFAPALDSKGVASTDPGGSETRRSVVSVVRLSGSGCLQRLLAMLVCVAVGGACLFGGSRCPPRSGGAFVQLVVSKVSSFTRVLGDPTRCPGVGSPVKSVQ